jgi:uncharacterized protein
MTADAPSSVEPYALADPQIDELLTRLEAIPPPLEPLGASAVDGWLAGVALQPRAVPEREWLRWILDVEGRPLPAHFDAARLCALLRLRHRQLDAAIAARQWFDPIVFEPDEDALPSQAVIGWVAGFAAAMEHYPALLDEAGLAAMEPLALLYRHLDPDDLEDADALLEEIETLEPPADMAEAVEDLVRATLLLADLSRPLARPSTRPTRRKPRHSRNRSRP